MESSFGETAEDQLFRVINMDGVSKITLTMDIGRSWELDHLQYGTAALVPSRDPATMLLVGFEHSSSRYSKNSKERGR